MDKDIMKNDKVVGEVREICRHLDGLDSIATFDEEILDNISSNYKRLFNRLYVLIGIDAVDNSQRKGE